MTKAHQKIVKSALRRPTVRQAYDALEEEMALLKEMLKARNKAEKTQAEVARAMHTTTSVVGRLETGGGSGRHSPTLATLRKYASALGYKLLIKFVPTQERERAK